MAWRSARHSPGSSRRWSLPGGGPARSVRKRSRRLRGRGGASCSCARGWSLRRPEDSDCGGGGSGPQGARRRNLAYAGRTVSDSAEKPYVLEGTVTRVLFRDEAGLFSAVKVWLAGGPEITVIGEF